MPKLDALLAEFGSTSQVQSEAEALAVDVEQVPQADPDETIELSGAGLVLETATEQPPLASESVEAAFAFFQEDGTGARVDAQVDQDPEIVAPEWSDARDSIDPEAGSEEVDIEIASGIDVVPAAEFLPKENLAVGLDADLLEIFAGESTELMEQLEQHDRKRKRPNYSP